MYKQSYKQWLFALVVVMISVLSFSVASTTVQATEKEGMVSDNLTDSSKDSQETPSKEPQTKEEPMSTGMSAWEYIKIVLALLFVVGLLFFVLKLVNRNNKKYQSNQLLQNLGGVSVGQQKSVQLLKVGDSLFLIGVGDDVNVLKEITDEQEQQRLIQLHEDKQEFAAQVSYITELYSNVKQKFTKQEAKEETKPFKNELDEKLAQIKKNRQQSLDGWNQKEKKEDE